MDNRKKIYPPRYNYWYWNDVYSTDEIKELHEIISIHSLDVMVDLILFIKGRNFWMISEIFESFTVAAYCHQ